MTPCSWRRPAAPRRRPAAIHRPSATRDRSSCRWWLPIAALLSTLAPVADLSGAIAAGRPAAPSVLPGAERIIAIGDLHGDLGAARRALRLAGAIDDSDGWVGGDLVVVQTGDLLDRGDEERALLDLLDRLSTEAAAAGGALHVLNGNHEIMNVELDLRYVTPGGFGDFEDAVEIGDPDSLLATYEEGQRARVAAFRPGGPYARMLARRNVAIVIGENVFVHGGLVPEHADLGLDRINAEVRAWMLGEAPHPAVLDGPHDPVWLRLFSDEVDDADCDLLAGVLERLGATRMIVGHTPQETGITSYCGGRVWCIDVGLAAAYGGPTQVLEITGSGVRVLGSPAASSTGTE